MECNNKEVEEKDLAVAIKVEMHTKERVNVWNKSPAGRLNACRTVCKKIACRAKHFAIHTSAIAFIKPHSWLPALRMVKNVLLQF